LAEAEIREAADWYEKRSAGLGRRFLAAVRDALEDLESDPRRFAKLETLEKGAATARILVKRFPYVAVFEVLDAEVYVYAVFRASRRPKYWRRRKREPGSLSDC
jgi:plasmid stabilization system protein ParE